MSLSYCLILQKSIHWNLKNLNSFFIRNYNNYNINCNNNKYLNHLNHLNRLNRLNHRNYNQLYRLNCIHHRLYSQSNNIIDNMSNSSNSSSNTGNSIDSTNTSNIDCKSNINSNIMENNKDYQFYLQLISYNQDCQLQQSISNSLRVILDAFRLYGLSNVITSFNGGKDAVVIMHLIRASYAKYLYDLYQNNEMNENIQLKPKFIYFAIENDFNEVIRFINDCIHEYDLDIIQYQCDIMTVSYLSNY